MVLSKVYGLIHDTSDLGEKLFHEFITKEGRDELNKFLRHSFYQMFIGELPIKPKPGYILDDSHAHYPQPRDKSELEDLVTVMAQRLGRGAITTWGMNIDGREEVQSVLRYKDVVDAFSKFGNIRLDNRGEVSIISVGDESVQLYPSQEIRTISTIEGFEPHITAEGCLSPIPNGLDARKTIELIHEQCGIATIEHNATKTHPIFHYTLTNELENAFVKELFEMADATEVFNSYNVLYMALSNALAKREAAKNPIIAKISGSDLHFGTSSELAKRLHKKRIGKTGIWLPDWDIKGLTGMEILKKKKADLKYRRYERLETYTDALTFFWTMIPPIFCRKMDDILERFGIVDCLHTDSIS